MGSGISGIASANPYKIDNPAGIPSNAITLEEFLDMFGVGDVASGVGIDRYAGANMTRMTSKQRQKILAEMTTENESYYAKRAAVREKYKELTANGTIRDKTSIEKIITRANQNPDLSSTQAARRMAEKRNIDWKTGKKLKGDKK